MNRNTLSRRAPMLALFLFVVLAFVLPFGGALAQDVGTPASVEILPEMLLTQERAGETAVAAMTATVAEAAPTAADVVVNSIEATEEATADDGSNVNVTINQPPANTPPDVELIYLSWQGLAALIGIVLTVGVGGGVGGALLIIKQARQSEEIKYAMERLYLSAPPGTQENIRQIVQLLVEGAGLADEVTDGILGDTGAGRLPTATPRT